MQDITLERFIGLAKLRSRQGVRRYLDLRLPACWSASAITLVQRLVSRSHSHSIPYQRCGHPIQFCLRSWCSRLSVVVVPSARRAARRIS